MARWFLLGSVILAACAAVACGDDSGSSGASGGSYCEVTCGCSSTLGAPASAVRLCVESCSLSGLVDYDSCPSDVEAFGNCLYSSGNCDASACTEELNALTECAFAD